MKNFPKKGNSSGKSLRDIIKSFLGTPEALLEIIQEEMVVYENKESARNAIKNYYIQMCKKNEKAFYETELGKIISAFGGRISGSMIYKNSYRARDIDIFFTDSTQYEEFLKFLQTAPGHGGFSFFKKRVEGTSRYEYLEDKSTVLYRGKKIDVNLVSSFVEIEDFVTSHPESIDFLLDDCLYVIYENSLQEKFGKNISETKTFDVPTPKIVNAPKMLYGIPKRYLNN